jgi:hypothetical protein
LVGGPGSDVDAAGVLPLAAAVGGLGAHDRGRVDEVQAQLRMALGEQGAEDTGAAADLAEVAARIDEQVSDLTLLGEPASHQRTADTAQQSPR